MLLISSVSFDSCSISSSYYRNTPNILKEVYAIQGTASLCITIKTKQFWKGCLFGLGFWFGFFSLLLRPLYIKFTYIQSSKFKIHTKFTFCWSESLCDLRQTSWGRNHCDPAALPNMGYLQVTTDSIHIGTCPITPRTGGAQLPKAVFPFLLSPRHLSFPGYIPYLCIFCSQ